MLAHDIALALDPCLLMQEAGLEPDPWQESFLRSNSDRQLLLCTRQAGKSTVTAILALHEALYTDNALDELAAVLAGAVAPAIRSDRTAPRRRRPPRLRSEWPRRRRCRAAAENTAACRRLPRRGRSPTLPLGKRRSPGRRSPSQKNEKSLAWRSGTPFNKASTTGAPAAVPSAS